MDNADGAVQFGSDQADRHEAAVAAGLADRRLRQDADPGPDFHRLLDRLDIIELHHDSDVHRPLPQVAVDLLADAQVAIEGHKILALKVLGRHGRFLRQAVLRAADQRHAFAAQGDNVDVGRRGRVGDDAQVDLGVVDRVVHLVGTQILQPHLGLGVAPHEILHAPPHVVQSHGIDRRHADQTADIHAQRPDPGFDRVVEFQDLAKPLVTGLPFGG